MRGERESNRGNEAIAMEKWRDNALLGRIEEGRPVEEERIEVE